MPAERSWKVNKHASDDGNYLVLDARGAGHLVGCVLSIDSRAPDPVKWWEGDEMISIDDDGWAAADSRDGNGRLLRHGLRIPRG